MIADIITNLIIKALAWWYRKWQERRIVESVVTSDWVKAGQDWAEHQEFVGGDLGYAPEDFRL